MKGKKKFLLMIAIVYVRTSALWKFLGFSNYFKTCVVSRISIKYEYMIPFIFPSTLCCRLLIPRLSASYCRVFPVARCSVYILSAHNLFFYNFVFFFFLAAVFLPGAPTNYDAQMVIIIIVNDLFIQY